MYYATKIKNRFIAVEAVRCSVIVLNAEGEAGVRLKTLEFNQGINQRT